MSELEDVILLAIFVLFFGYFIIRPAIVGILGYWSAGWPSSKGKVIEVTVRKRWNLRYGHVYSSFLKYKYEVDGKQYTNDRINFEGNLSALERSKAREYIEDYETGQSAEIHYLPIWPKFSVLEPGFYLSAGSIILFVVAILFLFFFLTNY